MTSDNARYLLDSLAWLFLGLVIASIYWRVWFHRKLVALGAVPKEQPMAVFVVGVVIMMQFVGLLFSESSRLGLSSYVHCQGDVNDQNVKITNDSRASAAKQLEGEIRFYEALRGTLSQGPDSTVRSRALGNINSQIVIDVTRIDNLKSNPLQPISSCKEAKNGS